MAVAHPSPAEYSGGRRWLVSRNAVAEHTFLSDCASAALVTRDGSVDWLCLPRLDSPPVLARLLDDDAGHLAFAPRRSGRRRRTPLPAAQPGPGNDVDLLARVGRVGAVRTRRSITAQPWVSGKQVRASQTSWRAAVA